MRQGICTYYLGPTDHKGSRIKAVARKRDGWGKEMSHTIPLDYSLNSDARHTKAAKALAKKLEWRGLWVGGGTPDDRGFQYVNLGSVNLDTIGLGAQDVDWFHVK